MNQLIKHFTCLFLALLFCLPLKALEDPKYSKELKKLDSSVSGFIRKQQPAEKDMEKVLATFAKVTATEDLGVANEFMGELYAKCKAPYQDLNKSYEYYMKAYDLLTDNTPVVKSKNRLMLGLHYFRGKAVPQDFEMAFKFYEEAASLNPALSLGLGRLYELGFGVPKDLLMAMACYNTACQNGTDAYGLLYAIKYALDCIENGTLDEEAYEAYQYGVYLSEINVDTDQEDECIPYFEKAAGKGFIPAYYELGTRCMNKRNFEEAEKWLTPGAEADFAPALHNLGVCYARWTMFKAFQYDKITKEIHAFERGAELGFAPSQYVLGDFYFRGGGTIQYSISKDLSEACKWFAAAADQGHISAKSMAEVATKQLKEEILKSIIDDITSQLDEFVGNIANISKSSTYKKSASTEYKKNITTKKSVSSEGSYYETQYHNYARKAINSIQHYANEVARYNNSSSSNKHTIMTGLNYQSSERLIKTYINEMKKSESKAKEFGRTISKSSDEMEVERGDIMAFIKSHRWN